MQRFRDVAFLDAAGGDLEELGEELLDVFPSCRLSGGDGGELVGFEVGEAGIVEAGGYCEVGDGADAAAFVGSTASSSMAAMRSIQSPNDSAMRS